MNGLRWSRVAMVLPLLLVTTGCAAGLGTISTLGTVAQLIGGVGRPGPGPQQVLLTAEVRQVDVRRQVIQVETSDGRAGGVLFDLATTVVRDHRPYPLNALREGDVVVLLLEDAPHNSLFARRIEVVSLARAADAAVPAAAAAPAEVAAVPSAPVLPADPADDAATEILEGEVGTVDIERGRFQMRAADERTVTVTLPFNPPAAAVERLARLRGGDTVRVEVTRLTPARVELERFADTPVPATPAPAPPAPQAPPPAPVPPAPTGGSAEPAPTEEPAEPAPTEEPAPPAGPPAPTEPPR